MLHESAGGRYLLAANYGSGSVSVHPVGADGRLGARTDLVVLDGRGPDPRRQQGSHAHQVVHDPDTGRIGVVDLGGDVVCGYRLDPGTGTLAATEPLLRCAPGAGPRHAVRHPGGAWYVVNELDGTVATFTRPGGPPVHVAPASTVDGPNQPAGIALSADGRWLYVSNRGPDTITTFALDGDGVPRVLAETPTGGAWPRHFAIVDDLLLVANQHSDSVVCLRIDPDTGAPEPTGELVEVGSPACVLSRRPARRPGRTR